MGKQLIRADLSESIRVANAWIRPYRANNIISTLYRKNGDGSRFRQLQNCESALRMTMRESSSGRSRFDYAYFYRADYFNTSILNIQKNIPHTHISSLFLRLYSR